MSIARYYAEIGIKRFRRTIVYRALRPIFLRPLVILFLFRLRYVIWLTDKHRHQYFVAGSGSGKSEFIKLMIWEEVRKPKRKHSAIVLLDPHGDLAEEVGHFKEFRFSRSRNRLVYIDPSLERGWIPAINPFAMKRKDEFSVAIMTQELKHVFEMLLSDSEPTSTMSTLLHACIATLLRRGGSTLEDLQRFMSDKTNADLVRLGQNSPNSQHASFFSNEFMSPDYRMTKRGIYTRLQSLLHDPIFQKLISSASSYDLEHLINQRKIIVFRLPLGEGGSESMQAYGRFIFGMLKIVALGRSKSVYRVPTYLYIDEFQNFISDDLERALTQFRKFGMYLVLSNQFPGQQGISTSLQRALFSAGALVVGRNEFGTLKRIEKHIQVPAQTLKRLWPGRFYIQTNHASARRVRVPTYLLGHDHSMSQNSWDDIKKEQLDRYYLRIKKSGRTPLHPLQPKYPHSGNF